MKLLKWGIALTLTAIIVQQSAFLYVENVYLNNDKEIVIEKVEESDNTEEEKNETIEISSDVDNIEVSDSGRYVAYIKDGKWTVLDSKENKENTINSDGEIVYCKWKTNADTLYMFKKVSESNDTYFELMPYNAKKNETQELGDFERKKSKIEVSDISEKIDRVAYSSLTNNMYVKTLKANGKSNLYYINIENTIKRVRENINLDDMVVPSNANKCIMEINGSATVLDSSENIDIPNSKTIKLLGADTNGNVYFGELSEDKIGTVYFKDLNDGNSKWNTLVLSTPYESKDIFINSDGTIFVNDEDKKTVTEVIGGKSLTYKGEFLQTMKDGFISKENNSLIKNYFNNLKKNK